MITQRAWAPPKFGGRRGSRTSIAAPAGRRRSFPRFDGPRTDWGLMGRTGG